MAEIWGTVLGAALVAGTSAVVASSNASKARKANRKGLQAGEDAGAFEPLAIPKPQELDVPSAQEILASWRGEVNTFLPEYDKIGKGLNVSEQEAATYANKQQNSQYYPILNQVSTNALQAGRGVIPKDVQDNIKRAANEDSYLRGFNYGRDDRGGFAGGNPAAANLALRNLGLTSLDMMKYGDALSGAVLEQSRAGRGKIISAKDVTPTPQIFQDQMNTAALAEYNYASDKAGYAAASHNAPIQAAYNKLALQMGVQGQSDALAASTSSQNMQLAMSALQAMGKSGAFSSIGAQTGSAGGGQVTSNMNPYDYYSPNYYGTGPNNGLSPSNTSLYGNAPIASASTISGVTGYA